MISVISTKIMNHGSHFRAFSLRDPKVHNPTLSPFIGVDHAWMGGPTFPPHPHAGLSAVSYLFLDSETGILNQDSIGTKNIIKPGGLHWTAAGSGIVHEEVPAEVGKTVHSLQIFVELKDKTMSPQALSLEAEDVPTLSLPGARIRVPLGEYQHVVSPLSAPTKVTLLDISLEPNSSIDIDVPKEYTTFVLPIFGEFAIENMMFSLNSQKVPVVSPKPTQQVVSVTASNLGSKFVLFQGQPL
ncbi:pirin family protein [Vibrio navarrensis]|uniref:pirin family protein n=1 Tax=Vibrio navarrensis TaxID=29495 RepID=UPI001869D6EA|nr:pirin family protein [Vibrio navarrensis]MBE4601118.1 pirin [Vibrio navarrensis]